MSSDQRSNAVVTGMRVTVITDTSARLISQLRELTAARPDPEVISVGSKIRRMVFGKKDIRNLKGTSNG